MANTSLSKQKTDIKDRLRRCAAAGFFFILVIFLQLILASFGHGIPCLFHTVTGLMCPGCGVTHMALAILKGDFRGAFAANPAVMIISLPLGLILCRLVISFVIKGDARPNKTENILLILMAVFLVCFGIIRNIH